MLILGEAGSGKSQILNVLQIDKDNDNFYSESDKVTNIYKLYEI